MMETLDKFDLLVHMYRMT